MDESKSLASDLLDILQQLNSGPSSPHRPQPLVDSGSCSNQSTRGRYQSRHNRQVDRRVERGQQFGNDHRPANTFRHFRNNKEHGGHMVQDHSRSGPSGFRNSRREFGDENRENRRASRGRDDSDCESVASSASFSQGKKYVRETRHSDTDYRSHSNWQDQRHASRRRRNEFSENQRDHRTYSRGGDYNPDDSDCESNASSVPSNYPKNFGNFRDRNPRGRNWHDGKSGATPRHDVPQSGYGRGEGDSEEFMTSNASGNTKKRDWNSRKLNVKFEIAESKKSRSQEAPDAASKSKQRTIRVGYKYLKELAEKPDHEILSEMQQPESAFTFLLEQKKLQTDWLFLMLKIISKVCSSEFVGTKHEMLVQVSKSSLLDVISFYLGEIGIEGNERTIANIKTFIDDLIGFYSSVISILPMLAFEKDFKKLIMKTKIAIGIVNSQFDLKIEEAVTNKLNNLSDRLEDYKNYVEKKMPSKNEGSYRDRIADMAPPEDFRELSLYPTYEDLTRNNFGFVRPNKVKGAYNDAEHYLDVQFRLLREDFIDPLRRGLKQYMEAKSSKETGKRMKFKYESVRLYPKTKFEQIETTLTNQVGYVLNFDVDQKMKKINWEYCKRFMFGSLLLFTKDDFETFFYGTVLDRGIKRLQSGRILVALASDVQIDETFFNVKFLMAESEVFFEPYFLVMKSLTTLGERNFPMPDYIIRGQRETGFPKYLANFGLFDVLGYDADPFSTENWPSASDLRLDDYQYRAFKKALTSEFCVIQGPPGTGKTFLGLKIVEVLLKNITLNRLDVPPILVVCYTNHALDQFLEGIVPMTSKIVRVGGQSKSEILKQYNLRGQNQAAIRRDARKVNLVKSHVKDEMKVILEEIHRATETKKKIENPVGVLKYSNLVHVMNNYQKHFIKNDEDLLSWLFQADGNDDADRSESEEEEMVSMVQDVGGIDGRNAGNNAIPGHPNAMDVDEDNDSEYPGIIDEDDIFDVSTLENASVWYCLTIDNLTNVCERYRAALTFLNDPANFQLSNYAANYFQKHELRKNIKVTATKFHILKEQLSNPEINAEKYKLFSAKDIRTLRLEQRWVVYWYWVKLLRDQVIQKLNSAEEKYRFKSVQYEEYKQIEDLHVVREANVVGMTTTGAARLRILLASLKPAIVIVEEAAEVLEAHIVTSLTHECEHVILIGDHKQLKPSAAVYQLSKHYNIDVSLFERMINNGMDCPSLNIQHRMRPEISCLITPLIYPNLENHESVFSYESIRGVAKNIFFLEHNVYEQDVDDTSSRKNEFEANFLLELCRYLILQGYNPSTITILTTYTGQMFLLREKKRTSYPLLKEVRCIVVDKYQGEENDIILLSLVRSNKEAKIGFLKTENRVCVALSRAKKALYIVGNMDNLSESSPMWKEIKQILVDRNSIGKEMRLYCDKHEIYTSVSTLKDFDQVREGGCSQYCGELLQCGHNCKSLCHTMDREHTEIQCREPCPRFCPRQHPCQKFCYQPCGKCYVTEERTLPCGHTRNLPCHVDEATFPCDITVDDISPVCKHPIKRKCYEDPADVWCSVPCEDRLDCGHACTQTCHKLRDPDHIEFKCHKPCEKLYKKCSEEHRCQKLCFEDCGFCTIQVKFQLPCGHEENHPCSVDINTVQCFKKCSKNCPDCNLKCRKKCWEDCAPCNNKVSKKVPDCGHEVRVECHKQPQRDDCYQMCNRNAPCGHKCKAVCSKPCNLEKCHEVVKIRGVKSLCGHDYVNVLCHKQNEVYTMDPEFFLKHCNEPCNEMLKCGDPCQGTCGQCWQGRLHKSCQNKCGNTLICGHSCLFPCRQVCPPCNEPCNYRCKHSKCPKTCGVPCVSCLEKCEWRCEHSQCTRKCGAMCDRKPCYKPCKKILKCNHPCIGFCGEPCPPQCRECNPEITEIMFGTEDEPDARFVYLEDCKHTIESTALDTFLQLRPEGGEIVMKVCPLCKTPITKTLRYMNYVKETYKHIINVKKKIFGNDQLLMKKRKGLTEKLSQLYSKSSKILRLTGLQKILDTTALFIETLKIYKNKRNTVSNTQLFAINYCCDVFTEIASRLDDLLESVPEPNSILRNRLVTGRRENPHPRSVEKLSSSETVQKIMKSTRHLIDRICNIKTNVNQQQSEDINCEVRRFHKMVDFHLVLKNPLYASNASDRTVKSIRDQINSLLFGCCRYTDSLNQKIIQLFEDFQKELKSSRPLTSDEKRMIHLAMSSSFYGGSQSTGHWFTCPNGHYFCITECGGAMQESNCPDCGVRIGGTNHAYLSTTILAKDMDGATHPAWSAGANMANYRF